MSKESGRKSYNKRKLQLNSLKDKCCVCGEDSSECIDFHHIQDKETNVWNKNIVIVVQELLKCCSVCANCHRKIHAGTLTPDLKPFNKEQLSAAFEITIH